MNTMIWGIGVAAAVQIIAIILSTMFMVWTIMDVRKAEIWRAYLPYAIWIHASLFVSCLASTVIFFMPEYLDPTSFYTIRDVFRVFFVRPETVIAQGVIWHFVHRDKDRKRSTDKPHERPPEILGKDGNVSFKYD